MLSASASASPTTTGTDRPPVGGRLLRARRRLAAPVDAAGLAAFRIVFGALLLVAVVRYLAKGMVHQAFVEPTTAFPLWSWLPPLPPAGMYALFSGLGLLATCLLLGLFTRWAAALFCLLFTYAHFSDLTHYLNHYYLVTLLTGLLAVVPSARIWSLDALRGRSPPGATVPAWSLGLLRFQVACVYFFAGVAKWRSDWLLHGLPLRIWLPANGDYPLIGPLLVRVETAYLASWAAAAFDTFVPFFLLWRRSRLVALAAAAAFHLLTVRLFRLGMFPFFMIGCSLLFLAPGWPRRLLRSPAPTPPVPEPAPSAPAPLGWPATLGLCAYVLVQVLFPLRQHLHPGHVLWTERGYRFSWHVMLMEKTGIADFTVRDLRTGKRWPVRLLDHLTPLQIKMMSTQPDLIRDFARTLACKEGPGVAVHADVLVSLNGRPLRPLIDPRVDLSAPHLPPGWILPFPGDPPP
jgi:vitamin K-dependent gamma-carboxylase